MKTIHKLSLAVMGIGALIGLGTHIDAAYNAKSKKLVADTQFVDAAKQPARRNRRAKNAKATVSKKKAVSPAMPVVQHGGVALMKKDDKSNEMFFMFKQMEQDNELSSSNVFNVALPVAKGNLPQEAKPWGQSGRFNLFVKEVSSWQRPDHNKNNSYVWIAESELTSAVDKAMKKHNFSNVTVQAKSKKMVELDKQLLSAIANHYKKKNVKSENITKAKKVKGSQKKEAKKVVA